MKNKFIVAIGCSAGGHKPLLSFFDCTPHDKATYVILRHLPYDYQSRLGSILQAHSTLKVVEVVNGMLIEGDTVYMPSKGMYMTIKDDRLYLRERSLHTLYPNKSIDVFLTSLAAAKGKESIAIILSGTGTDGSNGTSLIKEAGGMVIAQKPDSCEHKAMPVNAIKTGSVDYVLEVGDMPGFVQSYIDGIVEKGSKVNRLSR